MYLVLKLTLTAAVVVAVSELAKRSTTAGALLASLPLTTLLALVWLQIETGDAERIAALSSSIFWLVLPSLVLLLLLPVLLRQGMNFWLSLTLASAACAAAYGLMWLGLRRMGITV
jgi:hypothetical protein